MPDILRGAGRFAVQAVLACLLLGCSGGGSEDPPAAASAAVAPNLPAAASSPAAASAPALPLVKLKAPVLSFTDTGLNVSDGVTRNGLWSVTSDDLAWEYSLDQGRAWIKGVGGTFEVLGDGSKMIWVRARDDLGNTSEIVMVSCVLDTTPPPAVTVTPSILGTTGNLQMAGLEAGARWEYSLLGPDGPWQPGAGSALGVIGNGLSRLWLRQMDVAGNPSAPQSFALEQAASDAWHEASNSPLQPSVLATTSQTLLIHGSVVRNDADYVRWDVPAGHRLVSVRLLHYVSEDRVAFYALQRAAVFDAGVDVSRMLVYGHMGPEELLRNVVAAAPVGQLGAGPVTLWFQQTGALATQYAIEVVIQPVP